MVLARFGAAAFPASANFSLLIRGTQQNTTWESSLGPWEELYRPGKRLLWHGSWKRIVTGKFALVQKHAKQTSCRAQRWVLLAMQLGILLTDILSKTICLCLVVLSSEISWLLLYYAERSDYLIHYLKNLAANSGC